MKKTTAGLVPTYYDEFQCIGGACEDTCCAGWTITIDKKTFKNYKKEQNKQLKHILKNNISVNNEATSPLAYGKFKMDEQDRCSMLSDEGLCNIQLLAGEKSLCHTCTTYPRIVTSLNSTMEKALVPSCPEAARLILLKKEGIDFVEDLQTEDFSNLNNISYDENQITVFWKLRIFMIDTLQNRNHSIETRLLVISLCLQSLQKLQNITMARIEATIEKYTVYLTNPNLAEQFQTIDKLHHEQINLVKQLLTLSGSAQYNVLRDTIEKALNLHAPTIEQDYLYYDKNFITEYEYILENYLVNEVFSKIHFPNFELVLKAFAATCIHFSMIRLFLVGLIKSKQNLVAQDVAYCIQQYSKRLTHAQKLSDYISSVLDEDMDSILLKVISMIHK